MNGSTPDPILWRHLRDLPYFRAMLRAVEDFFYQGLDLPGPVLDVGCGDGHFASVAFDHPLDVGIDSWIAPLREAAQRKTYRLTLQGEGGKMPFADGQFASAVSNSVLEHIPHVDEVLKEIARVVRRGGLFVFCVPNDRFTQKLLGTQFFHSLGLKKASAWYARFFNRISRHAHCDSQMVWKERLERSGFEILRSWDYFPPRALHVLEAGHFFGLPALFSRKLTGRWIIGQNKANLWLTWQITHPHVQTPISEEGVYSFYITCRKA